MEVPPLSLQVECGMTSHGDAPQRFVLADRCIEVTEVLDRWLSTDNDYFKVRGADGAIYILRHDIGESRWELALYDSGARPETRLSST
jgi:hypothetical protein